MRPLLSVIVRFHNLDRLFELRRCLFSLVCQSYAPLEVCLVTQRFSESQREQLRSGLADILSVGDNVRFDICNYSEAEPEDARSALLNLGIASTPGRYLAFLDHDDTILAPAYLQLTGELEKASVAIAFGSVAYKVVDVFEDALIVDRRLEAFKGSNLLDLFDHNFCPLHSFVIDRSLVDPSDLWVDTKLAKHEDYDFLLRICAKYRSSFAKIGTFVGDYYLKNDGSNTNTWMAGGADEWEASGNLLQSRKSEIHLSETVGGQLGLVAGSTIADALKSTPCHDGQ